MSDDRNDQPPRPDSEVDELPAEEAGAAPGDLESALRERFTGSASIRMAKVEAVSRAIATGEYRVDPSAVAERILRKERVVD